VDCGSALKDCNEAVGLCTTGEEFYPGGCVPAVLECVDSASSCAPIVADCLQESSSDDDDCAKFVQQLFGGAIDPNGLVGSSGVAAKRWMSGVQPVPYVVSFGNEPTATAPAQQVTVTQAIDPNLDLSTLSLAAVTIPNGKPASAITLPIPPGAFNPAVGLNEFTSTIDVRPVENLLVNKDAKLNPATGALVWTFTSIDPLTGQPYPFNLANGFLPPASVASVLYSIRPKASLATGTTVSSQASVVFTPTRRSARIRGRTQLTTRHR